MARGAKSFRRPGRKRLPSSPARTATGALSFTRGRCAVLLALRSRRAVVVAVERGGELPEQRLGGELDRELAVVLE